MAKLKHGPIGTYDFRSNPPLSIERREEKEDYAFLTLPDPAERVYDSALSKPGRICKCCRGFVAGGVRECPECWALPS